MTTWAGAAPETLAFRRDAFVRAETTPTIALVGAVARAGGKGIAVPLHGAEPAAHDHHAGPGSFRETIGALNAIRSHGLAAAAWTALTRSNMHVLDRLPELLRARGVTAWTLLVVGGSSDAEQTRVVPRIGLAMPRALRAASRATKVGIRTLIVGAPTCSAGPHTAHLVVASRFRGGGPMCASCPSRPDCAGLDATYVSRFGSGELHATRELIALDNSERDAWARDLAIDWRSLEPAVG